MSTYYSAGPEKNPLGPYSAEEMRKLADEGKISDDTFVISEGQPNWVRFADWKAAQETSAGDFPPLPPDHACIPDPFASPKTPSSTTSTRVCEWCATSIPEEALKCPHCTKWRKDIAEDRKQFFTHATGSVVLCVLSAIFFIGVWGDSSDQSFMRSRQFADLGEWHERVVTGGKFNEGSNLEIMRNAMEGREAFGHPVASYEFSVRKFLSSSWGWTVIACVIAAVWGGVLARRARNSLERKTGSRWRL